ncbi:MAG: ribonuclease catalytic domain-containing protein [Candidatus Nanohaloarchaea archaeon]|nr:ribonuclease catalytic domain-containing protein [Candidatus Nanohaloarchaea archaeon]
MATRTGLEPRHEELLEGAVDGIDAVYDRLADVDAADTGRRDLRAVPTYTIDPADARDYDDALAVRDGAEGRTVYVHIADVPAVVQPGSEVDRVACTRALSTYWPDDVDHMLPGGLAEECSLTAGDDQPAATVEMTVDAGGAVVDHDIYRSVVRADANLSTAEADRLLTGETGRDAEEHLHQLRAVADSLDAVHGADAADASERLVEEFMVYTNGVCAEAMAEEGLGIYRVHGMPQDGWADRFEQHFRALGYRIPDGYIADADDPVTVAQELAEHEELDAVPSVPSPDDIAQGAAPRAYYDTFCRGHQDLGRLAYAPFTSPIRRYPDIINWRVLHGSFDGDARDLRAIARHVNSREDAQTEEAFERLLTDGASRSAGEGEG